MKNYGKKIFIYIFCGLLSFSVVSTSYYKSAHAMEWVGGALAFEEALKWLLAAVGITATAGMADAYWDTYGDDFVDYAVENGATQTEVAEWQLKACEGIIDKGSVVWEKFKSWAHSLVNGSGSGSGGGSVNSYTIDYTSVSGSLNSICNIFNIPQPNYTVNDSFDYCIAWSDGSSVNIRFIKTNYPFYCRNMNNDSQIFFTSSYSFQQYTPYFRLSNNTWSLSTSLYNSAANAQLILNKSSSIYASDNIINESDYSYDTFNDGTGGTVADQNFEGAVTNVNDLDVISSDGVDEDNPEVTCPMPGVSDSDNEASKDAYQDIIDAINDGTITQEDGLQQIQEILKIITYDTVTDKVVPPQIDPDTGEDKTKDEVLKENKDNMGFTLGGLEAVFPFCIPFDIYAFMTLLVAEPECPEFDFPIKSVNGQIEEIHIDLEPFEPVAVVVRYSFDFLFIIGLALLTRSLIGGGGSD